MPRRKCRQSLAMSMLAKKVFYSIAFLFLLPIILITLKNEVTTRLIQISMKVDDHVYRSHFITAVDARAFLIELAEYEPTCRGDERAVQVIEKLTRCMKTVLKEVNEPHTDIQDTNNVDSVTNCESPTYSNLDDDMTFVDDNHNKMVTDEDTISIISTLPDKDNNVLTTDVEIHRALTKLSINDDDCSQSILKDIENTNINNYSQQHNLQRKEGNQVVTIGNSPTSAFNLLKEKRVGTIEKQESVGKRIKSKTYSCKEFKGSKKPVQKRYKAPVQRKIMTDNKIGKSNKLKKNYKSNQRAPCIDLTQSDNENSEKGNEINKLNSQQVSGLVTNNKKNPCTISNTVCAKISSNSSREAENSPQLYLDGTKELAELITNNVKNPITIPKTVCAKMSSNSSKEVAPIYNERVENDLSWLENIRYVRELSPDEYDPQLSNLADDFWTNCTFPGLCDIDF